MSKFLTKNSLYLVTALAVIVGGYTAMTWSSLPVLQRMVALFLVGIVAHVWEENRYPGGFSEMITAKLNFTAKSKDFGESVTMVLVLCIAVVPLFFPHLMFLVLAPMLLGVAEAIAHTAMIWIFDLKRPYSPGLATALVVLLPISAYSLTYAVSHHLLTPLDWVGALAYMLAVLLLGQRIVVTASGMSYAEFMRRLRTAAFTKKSDPSGA